MKRKNREHRDLETLKNRTNCLKLVFQSGY